VARPQSGPECAISGLTVATVTRVTDQEAQTNYWLQYVAILPEALEGGYPPVEGVHEQNYGDMQDEDGDFY
jgi:hypothetical protein